MRGTILDVGKGVRQDETTDFWAVYHVIYEDADFYSDNDNALVGRL